MIKGKGIYLQIFFEPLRQLLEFSFLLERFAEKVVHQIEHHTTHFYPIKLWPDAMSLKYHLNTLTNFLGSWALMIECLIVLPKAVSTGMCVCVAAGACLCVCKMEQVSLMTDGKSLPFVNLSLKVDKHNTKHTLIALNGALGDSWRLFYNWLGVALDTWVMTVEENHCKWDQVSSPK